MTTPTIQSSAQRQKARRASVIHRHFGDGFTLIEALVALTLIAVALMACLKAAGNLNIQQDDILKRQHAFWSASNMANWVRISGVYPNAQTVDSDCSQGNFKFTCQLTITNTPNPNFKRVEITVKDAFEAEQGNQLARLVVFLSSAP